MLSGEKIFFGASLDNPSLLLFVAISRRKEKNICGHFAETHCAHCRVVRRGGTR